jgi:hypothetical protein
MKAGSWQGWQGWQGAPAQGEGCRCAPVWRSGAFGGQAVKGGAGGKNGFWSDCCSALEQGGKAVNAGKKTLARGGSRAVQ